MMVITNLYFDVSVALMPNEFFRPFLDDMRAIFRFYGHFEVLWTKNSTIVSDIREITEDLNVVYSVGGWI